MFLVYLILSISAVQYSLANTQVIDLEYDENGNLIQGRAFYYEYDEFNNLVRVRLDSASGDIVEEYTYDHGNTRIKKFIPATNTTYYYFADFVRKINDSGTYDTTYYYVDDQLLAKNESGEMSYFHPDHLGSTSLVTDEEGELVEETVYFPFGLTLSGGSEDRLFTGKELDDTNLYYYGARYYSPKLRKFVQPDPVLQNIYDPQSLNRYSYVRNNPVKYVDETGNVFFFAPFLIGAIAGFGFNIGFQLYMGATFSTIDWWSAGISAISGAIGAGIGVAAGAAASAIGSTGGTAIGTLSSSILNVAGGQAEIAITNVLEGDDITDGLFDPFDIGIDAALGVLGGAGGTIGNAAFRTNRGLFRNIKTPSVATSADLVTLKPGQTDLSPKTFSNNLDKVNPKPPGNYQAHHIIPRAGSLREKLNARGITDEFINSPVNAGWAVGDVHGPDGSSYVKAINSYLDEKSHATPDDIFNFALKESIDRNYFKRDHFG